MLALPDFISHIHNVYVEFQRKHIIKMGKVLQLNQSKFFFSIYKHLFPLCLPYHITSLASP